MERLEITEVLLSNISFENSAFRFDAEYFKTQYLIEDKLRKKYKTIYLGTDYFVTDGQHGYHEVDVDSEIRHLTAKNFKNWFANDDNADRLAKWVDDKNKRSSLMVNDVILTTRGSVGYCAIVKEDVLPANIDQDVARMAHNMDSNITPHYLMTYINSKFGQDWVVRNQTGMVQQGLALWRVKEFPIPRLSNDFQKRIIEIIEKSYSHICKSKSAYNKAENILLEEIGLLNFQTNKEAVNIKTFKESFIVSGRLDAEYYQKKFEEVIAKIKSQKFGILKNIVEISKSIEPGSNYYSDNETGLPFMRVSDYNKFGLTEPNKKLTLDFVKDNQDKIDELKPKRGTILFSKDGSVGTAYYLREDFEGVNSSAILHLKVKDEKEIIPEYLTLALNSKVVQMQAERDAGGSIILHWRVGEIQNVIVPIIGFEKQKQIAELVEKSFKLKNESEKLLDTAKRSVEIAIEQTEAKALQYIEKNMPL